MNRLKTVVTLAAIAGAALGVMGCDRNITRVESVAGPVSCAGCHDATNLITAKQTEWAQSKHGTGEAYLRGTSASCAACHSGGGFVAAVAAGLAPDKMTSGDPEPTRQDCRACHMIHDTYTEADFALRTTKPVTFYATTGVTYNGGEGNLCVNCHQPRRFIPAAVNGIISGISEHWGPHHGPQSAMLLGVAGAGGPGTPHGHYQGVANSCVGCHMGDGKHHTFQPQLDVCKKCHTTATNFDVNGVQTEIETLGNALGAALLADGLINVNSPDGHPVVTSAPEAKAKALWNWLYVMHEDKSMGVHNAPYARRLLEEGLAAFPNAQPVPRP